MPLLYLNKFFIKFKKDIKVTPFCIYVYRQIDFFFFIVVKASLFLISRAHPYVLTKNHFKSLFSSSVPFPSPHLTRDLTSELIIRNSPRHTLTTLIFNTLRCIIVKRFHLAPAAVFWLHYLFCWSVSHFRLILSLGSETGHDCFILIIACLLMFMYLLCLYIRTYVFMLCRKYRLQTFQGFVRQQEKNETLLSSV